MKLSNLPAPLAVCYTFPVQCGCIEIYEKTSKDGLKYFTVSFNLCDGYWCFLMDNNTWMGTIGEKVEDGAVYKYYDSIDSVMSDVVNWPELPV